MKAVIAVDLEGHYRSALNLLNRLDFQHCSKYMVHVLKPRSELLPSSIIKDVLKEFTAVYEPGDSIPTKKQFSEKALIIKEGAAAEELLRFADATKSDLVCATSTHHGALICYTTGSICRAFAIGANQSFLIAREGYQASGPIKAVFATDHSPYAQKAFEKLLKLCPCGIVDVTVLSVIHPIPFDPLSSEAAEAMVHQDELEDSVVREKAQTLSKKFEVFGATSRAIVRHGYPREEIGAVMAETGADLLILGAQGHGFLKRLFIGSTALHEVVSESFPVLVIRA